MAADPYHEALANLSHFIAQHGLSYVKGFYFVTNSALATVAKVWTAYGIGVQMRPADKMSIHSGDVFSAPTAT